jgi:hypothetical protein
MDALASASAQQRKLNGAACLFGRLLAVSGAFEFLLTGPMKYSLAHDEMR